MYNLRSEVVDRGRKEGQGFKLSTRSFNTNKALAKEVL